MGCDIHPMIERKSRFTDGDFRCWTNAGDPDVGRDYELFAVLAGVRNSMDIVPISEPRGIPSDACGEFEDHHEAWGADAHSGSWLSLKEIKAFTPTQTVEDDSLILQRKGGKITETCAGTTGKHLGPVGHRKVFELWGRENFDRLIAIMESRKQPGDTDDDVRLVFFFDN